MQHPELSLAGKLDIGLSKGLCWLLGWSKTVSLWLIGLFMLASLPWTIFEYGEGLADLAPLEWLFMLLLALLLWRHIHYASHFALGFWHGLHRLPIAQGVMFVLGLVVLGAIAAVLQLDKHPEELLRLIPQEHPIDKIVTFGAVLLAIFLGVPRTPATQAPVPASVQTRVEPEITPLAKEASL